MCMLAHPRMKTRSSFSNCGAGLVGYGEGNYDNVFSDAARWSFFTHKGGGSPASISFAVLKTLLSSFVLVSFEAIGGTKFHSAAHILDA